MRDAFKVWNTKTGEYYADGGMTGTEIRLVIGPRGNLAGFDTPSDRAKTFTLQEAYDLTLTNPRELAYHPADLPKSY